MNWDGYETHRIDLKRPLLVVQAPHGVLACGYLNVATFDKTGEACAIVSGVNDFDEMLTAKVVACSEAAEDAGIELGMTGQQVLEQFSKE